MCGSYITPVGFQGWVESLRPCCAAAWVWVQVSPLLGWECRVCSWSSGSDCSLSSAPLRDSFPVALLINSLCFPGALSRFADTLISLFPLLPLPLPSVGSTSSSPALLGIREPRSEYDRTQPPMQYYNSQGDTTHKGLYPGKTPVGCVI